MKLTIKELALIDKAEQAVRAYRIKVSILLGAVFMAALAFFNGLLTSDQFAIACVVSTLLAVAAPQMNGPAYQDLVQLLIRVREESEHEKVDPIIDALSKSSNR